VRVPRRTPAARPGRRDRARPSTGRAAGASGPAAPGIRGRSSRKDEATPAQEQSRRRTTFTGRAAVLALAVCALALSLAYPIQRYVDQRQQLASLREEVAGRTERVRMLEEQLQRWQDPAYVRQQARRRLHFVMPGETGYVVIGPGGAPLRAGGAAGAAGLSETDAGGPRPWYDRLWASVDAAARAPVEDVTTPARKPATHLGPGSDAEADAGTGSGSGTGSGTGAAPGSGGGPGR
jgi:cell division protein FtsB